jgi:hypothetical protein
VRTASYAMQRGAPVLTAEWMGSGPQQKFDNEPRSRKNYLERERDNARQQAALQKDREAEVLAQQMATYTLPVCVPPHLCGRERPPSDQRVHRARRTMTTEQKIALLERKLRRIEQVGAPTAPLHVTPRQRMAPAAPTRPAPAPARGRESEPTGASTDWPF